MSIIDPIQQTRSFPAPPLPNLVPWGKTVLARYGLLISFLVFWQIAATTGIVNPTVFPPLDKIAVALFNALAAGRLFAAIFLLALFGLAANALLIRLQRHLCAWAEI